MVVSSLISVFDDFGSGVYVPELGIVLNNRAAGFTGGANAPGPRRRPVHTLAPAVLAHPDGDVHADRVGAIHVKDVFADHLGKSLEDTRPYGETAATKRLWAEPGRGVLDFDAILAAMPDDYTGDFMIEVDVPSIESTYDSLKESYDWAKQALSFARL